MLVSTDVTKCVFSRSQPSRVPIVTIFLKMLGSKKNLRKKKMITCHLLGLPHTITRADSPSQCAFTGKVLRFTPMLKTLGGKYRVVHYGVETSESGADEEVMVLTKDRWQELRVEHVVKTKKVTPEEAAATLADPKSYIGDLADVGTALYREFNENLRTLLHDRIEGKHGVHIVCLPFGLAHASAIAGQNFLTVESGIGYPHSFLPFRIFESSEYMHTKLGEVGNNYWFVCPNYYDLADWRFCQEPTNRTVRFLGRLNEDKGLSTIVECASRMPDTLFEICGPGNPEPYLRRNIVYVPPLQGNQRAEYLGNCAAVLTLTAFVEPFNGVSAEAQLCGTPVISTAYGAFMANVEHGKTGVHTHTLQDVVEGIRMAQAGKFDRAYIRTRAESLWGYKAVAKKYDYAFSCMIDVKFGAGWYQSGSHLRLLE